MWVGTWVWGVSALASVGTLVMGRPWTALLSGRRYDQQVRAHPYFVAANMWITAGWTAYFTLAAVVTALTIPWSALAFSVPTPLLGWASFQLGDRYAPWRQQRAMRKGTTVMTTSAQHELRTAIAGLDDDEMLAWLRQAPGGVQGVLDLTVSGMPEALDPDNAQDCVVGYDIDVEGDHVTYRVEVHGRDVDAARRPVDDARVVLQLSAPEYLRLITGLLDGTDAFMSGRMGIRGDVMFAPQIGRMFPTT
jgi:putative sterol carrier protein